MTAGAPHMDSREARSTDGPVPGALAPDALGLATALAERGMECVVEARERLAVLFASDDWPALAEAAERRALHRLATAHGFTHVALELEPGADDDDGGAATTGDAG